MGKDCDCEDGKDPHVFIFRKPTLSCEVEMGFVKVVKNKAYFKRFQMKFKRRRGREPSVV